MSLAKVLVLSALALPLSAQAWDLRVEAPYPQGQSLPDTLLGGAETLLHQQSLNTGSGYLFSASHRIIRVGPVLKLEWGVEDSHLQADGQVQEGAGVVGSRLKQYGLGVGLNAQFWVPFTGLAAEFGAIERFQAYRLDVNGTAQDQDLARPWLRVGLRYSLPLPVVNPYLAASYQQPITKDHPVQLSTATDLATYLASQGSGQEFQRMWTFGVGITF